MADKYPCSKTLSKSISDTDPDALLIAGRQSWATPFKGATGDYWICGQYDFADSNNPDMSRTAVCRRCVAALGVTW